LTLRKTAHIQIFTTEELTMNMDSIREFLRREPFEPF